MSPCKIDASSSRSPQNIPLPNMVMFYLDDGFPSESGRIADDVQFRMGGEVEDDVEPEVTLEAFRSLKLVGRKRHLADVGSAFDFDESHFNRGPRVFGMWPAQNEVEAAVLTFNALHLPSTGLFVGNDRFHGNTLDLGAKQ